MTVILSLAACAVIAVFAAAYFFLFELDRVDHEMEKEGLS